MGSWYIQSLLRNREAIKRNAVTKHYSVVPNYSKNSGSSYSFEPWEEINLEDEDYNNLILIEAKLKELEDSGTLNSKERKVLKYIINGSSLTAMENDTSLNRVTISKIFVSICDRLAYLLGDGFTDEGYLSYMQEKYNLTEDQLEKAIKYMESNKKNYVLKRSNK